MLEVHSQTITSKYRHEGNVQLSHLRRETDSLSERRMQFVPECANWPLTNRKVIVKMLRETGCYLQWNVSCTNMGWRATRQGGRHYSWRKRKRLDFSLQMSSATFHFGDTSYSLMKLGLGLLRPSLLWDAFKPEKHHLSCEEWRHSTMLLGRFATGGASAL